MSPEEAYRQGVLEAARVCQTYADERAGEHENCDPYAMRESMLCAHLGRIIGRLKYPGDQSLPPAEELRSCARTAYRQLQRWIARDY